MKSRLMLMAMAGAMAVVAQIPDKSGFVQIKVTPPHAGVFVDGKYMGPSTLFATKEKAIRVAVGNHRVEVLEPYHETLVTDFQVTEGQYNEIAKELKANGKEPKNKVSAIVTEGFGEAAIYLDNEYFGHAGRELRVKPGKFMLKLTSMDGTILREIKVELRNRETLVVPRDGAPVVKKAN
ncbi:MAG TPA: PEGA domain-containing protein [Paludibaculum sp.]|jgi:hypothetical protein